MENWFTEFENKSLSSGYLVEKVIFSEQSDFQKVEVLLTKDYGLMLVLDDCVMITEKDEFVYHEMISHIPMCMHKGPESIAVIGGGDGGTIRELLKYPFVKRVVLCEIDKMVIEVCKKYFPKVSCSLDSTKVDINMGDGIVYIEAMKNQFDLVIVDSTDPVGPGEGLFTEKFYNSVASSLKKSGLMIAQTESPWQNADMLKKIHQNITSAFKYAKPYTGAIPTYPRGLWSWTVASQEPLSIDNFSEENFSKVSSELEYLTLDLCKSVFNIPKFYSKKLYKI